jgi:hypothetical protein
MAQFITEDDLNAVKGLIHYLSQNIHPTNNDLSVEVVIVDSNGEQLGRVEYNADVSRYVFMVGGG